MRLSDNLILFALRLGAAALRQGHATIGLKRILYPVGYWRYPIFRYVQMHIGEKRRLKVLDIGSPKLLALWLAAERDCDVLATDYQDPAIFRMWAVCYEDLTRSRGSATRARLRAELQDARALPYEADRFDLVYAISVVEHIPDDGDRAAMKEIARVLRPGGTAIIEVPFAIEARDSYVRRDVYGMPFNGVPVFYQRHYDLDAVAGRLVKPSGLRLVDSRILAERWVFEHWWSGLPEVAKAPAYWLEWMAASVNLREVTERVRAEPDAWRGTAMDVILSFEKD